MKAQHIIIIALLGAAILFAGCTDAPCNCNKANVVTTPTVAQVTKLPEPTPTPQKVIYHLEEVKLVKAQQNAGNVKAYPFVHPGGELTVTIAYKYVGKYPDIGGYLSAKITRDGKVVKVITTGTVDGRDVRLYQNDLNLVAGTYNLVVDTELDTFAAFHVFRFERGQREV